MTAYTTEPEPVIMGPFESLRVMPLAASVICPVYNEVEVTMDFVLNMLPFVQPPHELIVVANGCTDSTVPFLVHMKRAGHNVKTVISERNLGFGGGNNLGAKEAENFVHIFLSNDVRASGEFIPEFVRVLTANPSAVTGRRILRHDTGWNTYLTGRDMHIGGTPVARGTRLTVPYVEGWCVAVNGQRCHYNRAEKGQIGGLWDERYFPCDFDDVDVGMQAIVDGRTLIEVNVPLKHEHTGQTANKILGGRLAVTERNQQRFMEKWGLIK